MKILKNLKRCVEPDAPCSASLQCLRPRGTKAILFASCQPLEQVRTSLVEQAPKGNLDLNQKLFRILLSATFLLQRQYSQFFSN